MNRRALHGIVVASFFLLLASSARADPQAELEKARIAYSARAYADAEARLRELLDPNAKEKLDPALVPQARMYLGAAFYLQQRKSEADAIFERILEDDARFEPDPLTFPTDVLNAFIDTRARMRERLNAAAAERARLEAEKRTREEQEKLHQQERVRILESMAAEEKTTVRHSRLVASMPFGAGQFQNGQNALGWTFLGIESALAIASAVTLVPYATAVERANDENSQGDPDQKASQYHDRAVGWQIANWSIVGALAAVAAGGVLHAQLTFVSEVPETHTRAIPQARLFPSLAPMLSATPKTEVTPASGFLGLRGAF